MYEEEVSRSSWRWHCRSSLGYQRAEDSAAQLERVRIPNKNHIGKRVTAEFSWQGSTGLIYFISIFTKCHFFRVRYSWRDDKSRRFLTICRHTKTTFRIWKSLNLGPEMFLQWPAFSRQIGRKILSGNTITGGVWRLQRPEATAQRHMPNIHSSVANQQWWKRP